MKVSNMARGLMSDPKVLLVDEPTAGMAPKFEAAVWQHIVQIRRTGVAVVVVEQNTRRTLTHADWAYVLVLGKNRLLAPPLSCSITRRWWRFTSGGEPEFVLLLHGKTETDSE